MLTGKAEKEISPADRDQSGISKTEHTSTTKAQYYKASFPHPLTGFFRAPQTPVLAWSLCIKQVVRVRATMLHSGIPQ